MRFAGSNFRINMLFLKKYTLVKLWAHLVSTNVLVLQQLYRRLFFVREI